MILFCWPKKSEKYFYGFFLLVSFSPGVCCHLLSLLSLIFFLTYNACECCPIISFSSLLGSGIILLSLQATATNPKERTKIMCRHQSQKKSEFMATVNVFKNLSNWKSVIKRLDLHVICFYMSLKKTQRKPSYIICN